MVPPLVSVPVALPVRYGFTGKGFIPDLSLVSPPPPRPSTDGRADVDATAREAGLPHGTEAIGAAAIMDGRAG